MLAGPVGPRQDDLLVRAQPSLDSKRLSRIAEAQTWYAAAARKNLGLMFFAS
ncbi:MAG: hypothetical protein LC798_08905 [Chloroflexi bacterium]|nr:hypothetical protein [Chloroflexota bacterium]